MRGKLVFVMLVSLAVLLAGCTQMGAEEIAKKIEEKYNAIEDFKGVLRVYAEGEKGKFVMEYEYVFKKPNKVKMYDKMTGMLIISDGERMWIYDKRKNEVFTMDVGTYNEANPDYGEFVKDMLERYDVELLGSEKVSGRDSYVILLKSKDSKNDEVKMWVDKEFWYPLKIEQNIGGIKTVVEYMNVKFNTGVSDDEFEFTLPEGAKIVTEEDLGIRKFDNIEEVQKYVSFKILKPAYTAGYELKEVSQISDSVNLLYFKGGNMLMITETKGGEFPKMPNAEKVKVGDSEGLYTQIYGSGMLVFKRGDVLITITGVVEKEELIKIAESME